MIRCLNGKVGRDRMREGLEFRAKEYEYSSAEFKVLFLDRG